MKTTLLKKNISFIAALIISMAFTGCSEDDASIGKLQDKPNVLFIVIDDLNDWIGCLGGHPDTKTPNIDKLANQGMLFTNAHCPAPLCNPSRAAVMTSIRPSSSGVYKNNNPWQESPVLKDASTIPQYFQKHGYTAIGSGKIYHDSFPDSSGWDEFWPALNIQRPKDPVPFDRPLNGISNTGQFDWGSIEVEDSEMGDVQVAQWVIDQLNKDHENNFFLACGFYRPHLPWFVPRKYFEKFPLDEITLPNVNENDLDDVPDMGKKIANPNHDHKTVTESGQWKKAVQGYLASINFVDECVGKVLDALEKSKYSDNTIVVLWSDHGWHLGEKLHWRKFSLWEEATRNVLIFKTPGMKNSGEKSDAPVNLIDIYPTLIDLCELDSNSKLEGTSLLPLIKSPDKEWNIPSLTTHERNNHSLRSDRWRYIRYSDGTEELYDHSVDELEWNNLAGNSDYNEIKNELAKWLPTDNVEEIGKLNRDEELKRIIRQKIIGVKPDSRSN